MTPCVSVIMSVYNEPVIFIRYAVESILNQTLENLEFIIVNDNPGRDDLSSLLREFEKLDPRIFVIDNENNLGLTASLNVALQHVRAKYTARMDADDISVVDRLHRQYTFLELYQHIDICGSLVELIDEDGKSKGGVTYPLKSGRIKAKMFLRDCICHPSVMIKTARLKELGGYNNEFKKSQDYELWVRSIISGSQFSNIENSLLKYRVHGGNISIQYSGEQELSSKKCKIKLYEYYSDFNDAEVIYRLLNEDFNLGQFFTGLPKLIAMVKKATAENKDISYLYMSLIIIKRIMYLTYRRLVC